MAVEEIVLSLYLLFPQNNPNQVQLTKELGIEEYVVQDTLYQRNVLNRKYGEYFPETVDDGSAEFPDEYLQGIQNEIEVPDNQKSILEDLEHPTVNPQSEASSFVTGLTEDGKPIAEIMYKTSMNKLRQMEYGVEHFSVNYMPDGNMNLVNASDRFITLTEYDDQLSIVEKTVWLASEKSLSEMSMQKRVLYKYGKNQDGTKSAIPEQIVEEAFGQGEQSETVYDKNYNPITVKLYTVTSKKKTLKKTTNRTFDNEGRITSEEEILYGQDAGRKKNVYKYTKKADFPDYDFYEDGVLRIRDVYLNNDCYDETIYFDEGYSVKCQYKKGVKVSEIIYIDGMELRSRDFEEQL